MSNAPVARVSKVSRDARLNAMPNEEARQPPRRGVRPRIIDSSYHFYLIFLSPWTGPSFTSSLSPSFPRDAGDGGPRAHAAWK